MFGLKNLKKLKHLRHLGKIRKHLHEIQFELKFIRQTLRDEIERSRGSIVSADCPNYDERRNLEQEEAQEIEELISEVLDLKEEDKIITAVTPMKVYLAEDKRDNL